MVNLASSSSVVADTQSSTAALVLPSFQNSTITEAADILGVIKIDLMLGREGRD
jgi:hypothetical protein